MSDEQGKRIVAITRQFTDDDVPCVMMDIFGPAQTETTWLERYDVCITAHATYFRCNDQWSPIDGIDDLVLELVDEFELSNDDVKALRSALNDLSKVMRVSTPH